MQTVHDLVLAVLVNNPDYDFASIRGSGFKLSYSKGEKNGNGRDIWYNVPENANRLQELQFLYDSHVNTLEYFATKSKDESDKRSAKQRLSTLHNDYAPFIKVKPYGAKSENADKGNGDINGKLEKLLDMLLEGEITRDEYKALKAKLENGESGKPRNSKIRPSGVQTDMSANDESNIIRIEATKSAGKTTFFIGKKVYKATKFSTKIDSDFTAILVDKRGNELARGKFILRKERTNDYSVELFQN